jgi:hypothetical protein
VGRGRGVTLGVTVAVGVGVGLIVGVGVIGGEGVGPQGGVGASSGIGLHHVTLTVSTRQPSPEPLLSLAILHRSIPKAGMSITVVINPCELPLQA